MSSVLMLDTNQDCRALLGHLGLINCRAVARYLFAGATDPQGNVPEACATPVCAAEIAAIHATGLSVLLVDNSIGWGDVTGPNAHANGRRKGNAAVAAANALGAPRGCTIACDLETWAVDPGFILGWCERIAAGGYTPMLYGSAGGAWRPAWEQASGEYAVCNCWCWTARYVGDAWAGDAPAWDPQDDGGAQTVLWQFSDKGPAGVDLSEVQPALLVPGALWTPASGAQTAQVAPHEPAPTSGPAVDVAAVLERLRAIVADAQKTEADAEAAEKALDEKTEGSR